MSPACPRVDSKCGASRLSYVFAIEFFYAIASYSGWSTVCALRRVASTAHLSWTLLADRSQRALEWRTAIIGTYLNGGVSSNRLGVFSESGLRLQYQTVPRPRYNPACVFDGSHLLYILGGIDIGRLIDGDWDRSGCLVDSFDMHTQSWLEEPDMITGRFGFGVCRVGKELLAIAGICATTWDFSDERSKNILSSIDVCHLTDGSWQPRNALHCPRHDFALATFSSRMYVIGGMTRFDGVSLSEGTMFRTTNSMEVISEAGLSVRTCPGMPVGVWGCVAVVVGHRILVVGGLTNSDASAAPVQDFDTDTQIWTVLQPILRLRPLEEPFNFDSGICIHTDGCIRLIGGKTGARKFLGEALFDERFDTCEVRERSTWGFALGVAVPLHAS